MTKSQKLAMAQKLAEAMEKEMAKLDEKTKKAAFEELMKIVDKAAAENALAEKGLEESIFEGLHDFDLSPEDLEKLAKALQGASNDLKGKIGRLARFRLIDVDELKPCDGDCDCEGDECEVARIVPGCRGGKGGVTEGPGHNEITWTDGTSCSPTKSIAPRRKRNRRCLRQCRSGA